MRMAGRLGILIGVAGATALVIPASIAHASWPMGRHDAKRTGAVTGTGNLTEPTAYWRTYLGGAIGGSQFLVANVTGSGTQEALLLATGGKVVAKDPTDTILWQTPTQGITSFAGIGDVNGDGILDVVAESTDQVIIASLRTGAIEWTEPAGQMGTIGTVRVGDVNGDGLPDVLVVECGSCGVNSGNTGFYWSFAQGFSKAAVLGSIPASTFTGGTFFTTTLVQATTSNAYETLLANGTQFSLLDGSGNILGQTNAMGSYPQFNECTTGNVDGNPGDEVICFLSTNQVSTSRVISVLHYDYTAVPPALDTLWSRVVAPATGGDLEWVDPVQDLDGDGQFELVASTNDPTNGLETHIYDAASGTELVSPIPGQMISGTAAMESTTSRVILTSSGSSLTAWAFTRSPTPAVSAHWTQSGVTALTYTNQAEASLESINSQIVAADLNGNGLADAIVQSTSAPTTLEGLSGAGGSVAQMASFALPSATDVLTTWVVPPITVSTPQVALARSDGILNLLDGHLQPTSTGTPPAEVDIHVGGYYASGAWREFYHTPRLAALGSGPAQSVVVDDSRSALLRIDAASASLAVAPTVAWQVTHTYGPTISSGLVGTSPAMACLALTEPVTNPPQYRVRVVKTDGTIAWDEPLTGFPLNDLAPGNFNGDGVPDFALQVGSMNNPDISTLAFSGSNGALLWTTSPVFPGGGGNQSAGVSIGQWDSSSAIDDIYYQGTGTFVLSGSNGAQLAMGGNTDNYSLPMLYDTSGSGQDEVILNAGQLPVSLYSHDLQTALWVSSDNDKPYPYGALAQCPGTSPALVLVEGSWQNPARLKLTPMNGASLGAFGTVVLAGGQLFANETAAGAAGAFLGQLTAANVHSNLTGKNHPTAVVGSSDGWFYGLNPCNGTLDFAVQIGSSVGEAVFGDTDGDGVDELLVTAADGYLYDYKGFSLAPPAYVWDTDPDHGITNHDVDTIETTNKLSALWASVSGATSYAVEVVTAEGLKPVSTPLWKNVGNVTSISLPGLPLTDGTKYIFAVRAVGPNGPSIDALSNGVTVHFPVGADAGAGDAGGPDASADSGKEAGGGEQPEAGSGSDASVDAGTAGEVSGGGCGCSMPPRNGGMPSIISTVGIGLAALARRRRTRS